MSNKDQIKAYISEHFRGVKFTIDDLHTALFKAKVYIEKKTTARCVAQFKVDGFLISSGRKRSGSAMKTEYWLAS